MQLYKTIIQGRLEFGTERSYETVLKQFQMRADSYYKNELVLKEEEIFNEDQLAIIVPRFVGQSSEKWFKNSMSLLSYCAQFAVAGSLHAWMTNEGKILHHFPIEPDSEKVVVQSYLKGKALVKTEGKEDEALEKLTMAIEKYDKHAQAYERRAKVNVILKKYHDAMRDYNKSIGLYKSNPHAYFGRAKVHYLNGELELAIEDFEQALKTSVALQSLYWKTRRFKGEIHMKLKQWEKAAFDFKLFCNRKFANDDPNFIWRRSAFHNYALVLLAQEAYQASVASFDNALSLDEGPEKISDASILYRKGMTKKQGGMKKYRADIKEAAELGYEDAIAFFKKKK